MKLADYVIEYLRDIGIKHVFVVYGAATGDLVDAFSRVKGIDYICPIHEQAGSFAVEAYAKVSGELSCFIATSGPGGTNLLTGIANAYYDSVPCIFITGQIHSQYLRRDESQRQVGFQENDIVSMAKPITKLAVMVKDASDIKWVLDQAVPIAKSGRPGPVLIDIPMDIQKVDIVPDLFAECEPLVSKGAGSYEGQQIEELVTDLKKAQRPVLLVGSGIWYAKAAERVRELGSVLQIPCLPTWNATDIFTSDYEYYRGRVGTYGGPGRNFAIQNSDLLLAIGTRISGRITGGYVEAFARGAKKYIVDIDQALLNPEWQEVKGDVNIHCDAKLFINLLLQELKGQKLPDWTWWLDKTKEWRDNYTPCLPEYYSETEFVHPYAFVKTLSEECQSGDVITADCGGNAVVTFQTFETKYGQRLISSNGNSPMGHSFAAAMGACFIPEYRNEEKGRVICLIGDGGFQMNIQELQTVKHYGLKLKTFIFNNHSYGITRQYQETNFQGRYLASGPDGYSVPDFVQIVQAYGIDVAGINNHRFLREQIRYVLQYPKAIVCDVDMSMYSKYEPRIFGWRTPIEDMTPYLPRDEFRANMIIEPVEGWEKPVIPGKVEGTGLA